MLRFFSLLHFVFSTCYDVKWKTTLLSVVKVILFWEAWEVESVYQEVISMLRERVDGGFDLHVSSWRDSHSSDFTRALMDGWNINLDNITHIAHVKYPVPQQWPVLITSAQLQKQYSKLNSFTPKRAQLIYSYLVHKSCTSQKSFSLCTCIIYKSGLHTHCFITDFIITFLTTADVSMLTLRHYAPAFRHQCQMSYCFKTKWH